MKRRSMPAFLLLVAGLLYPAAAGSQTECLPRTLQETFRAADTVFLGKAVSWGNREHPETKGEYTITFRVIEGWKGVHSIEVTVYTNSPVPDDGGYTFVPGKVYLVFAKGGYTGYCWRSREMSAARNDIARLGPPEFEVKEKWPGLMPFSLGNAYP